MRLRIVSWNVRGMACMDTQLALIERERPDIVLLQDISSSAAQTIRERGSLGNVVHTWTGTKSSPAPSVRSGCLIATTHRWELTRSDYPGDSSSERVLIGTAACETSAVTLFSCYAPTNVGARKEKRVTFFTALAQQLAVASPPLILGMDANGPRVDHPDLAQNVWWTPEEAAVLGPDAPTSDVLRLWYQNHPEEWKRRLRYYPQGPLADSYHRGRKGKYLRSRYDSIRVSPGMGAVDVRYLYDDAIQTGSDHALVVADIELT
jgi:exonuclease III